MPSLSIKNVPQALLEAIRRRAARNQRSLQGELMAIIAKAVAQEPPFQQSEQSAPTQSAASSPQVPQKSIEQIAVEHRARWPQAFESGPRGVNIIRADRDSR